MAKKRTLTKEQQEIYDTLTDLQKACVDIKIKNPAITDADAYRQARNISTNCSSYRHSRRYAYSVFSNDKVKAFLKSLEVETLDDMLMTRQQIMDDLSDIAETVITDIVGVAHQDDTFMNVDTGELLAGPGQITIKRMEDIPPEAWKAVKSIKQTKYGISVELIDPAMARKMINEMQGYNAPVEQNVNLNGPKTLDDFYGDS